MQDCIFQEEVGLQVKKIINEIDPDIVKCSICNRTFHIRETFLNFSQSRTCKSCAYDTPKDPWESECLR